MADVTITNEKLEGVNPQLADLASRTFNDTTYFEDGTALKDATFNKFVNQITNVAKS